MLAFAGCSEDDGSDTTPPPPPPTSTLAHTNWQPSDQNPVLDINPETDGWDSGLLGDPEVILFRDTLRMWYSGSSDIPFDGVVHLGYAWSLNGWDWNRMDAPVFELTPGGWDYPHLAKPTVFLDGDTLRMYYGAGTYTAAGMAIGYAKSVDGIHWVRHESPVITGTKAWNQDGVLPGPVLKEDGLYKMWLAGGLNSYAFPTIDTKWSTGYATSEDGIHWTVSDEPVLPHGAGESFDSNGAVAGSVVKTSEYYEMFYSGSKKAASFSVVKIALATSEDGITWEKYEGNPILERSSASIALYFPRVRIIDGEYRMWYVAWRPGPSIHYAVEQ